jgi:hypothetical protein
LASNHFWKTILWLSCFILWVLQTLLGIFHDFGFLAHFGGTKDEKLVIFFRIFNIFRVSDRKIGAKIKNYEKSQITFVKPIK